MKLLIVTAVSEYQDAILKLFRKANIEAFSTSEIDGFKQNHGLIAMQSWFPTANSGNESVLFFTFTDDVNIDVFFELGYEFNQHLETNNPIRAVVVPIERSL